jgi:hypothetical protein
MNCNGDEIPEPSPWAGQNTPNLNGNGLFLRGSNPENVLEVQEDAFEDHSHGIVDPGHSHADTGHEHEFSDYVHITNHGPVRIKYKWVSSFGDLGRFFETA